jgi:hypothetical protein
VDEWRERLRAMSDEDLVELLWVSDMLSSQDIEAVVEEYERRGLPPLEI